MNIETQFNNRCVARGLSIMRIVLGYDGIIPFEIEKTQVQDIINIVGKVFPDNEVYVWSHPDKFEYPDINVHYCGDNIPDSFDDIRYIIGFSYFENFDGPGHFVVGWPVAYNNLLGLVIAVEENVNERLGV